METTFSVVRVFNREINFRIQRNRELTLCLQYAVPKWNSLAIYPEE